MRVKIHNPSEELAERLRAFGSVEEMEDHLVFCIPDDRVRIRLPNRAEKKRNRHLSHIVHVWCPRCSDQQHFKSIRHGDGIFLTY